MPISDRRRAWRAPSQVERAGFDRDDSASSARSERMAASYASDGYSVLSPPPPPARPDSAPASRVIFPEIARHWFFQRSLRGFPLFPSADSGRPPSHVRPRHACPQSDARRQASSTRPDWTRRRQDRRRRASSASSPGQRKDETSTGEPDRPPSESHASRMGRSGWNSPAPPPGRDLRSRRVSGHMVRLLGAGRRGPSDPPSPPSSARSTVLLQARAWQPSIQPTAALSLETVAHDPSPSSPPRQSSRASSGDFSGMPLGSAASVTSCLLGADPTSDP
mmetsp:Transcript_22701/g.50489  ORF Transcript_22701/g.50489 Transcript_22701/m.50489 type:complete len:278 (+) Transcript_22701:1862-2695(+)